MPTDTENVRLLGKTRSDRRKVKTARLTLSRIRFRYSVRRAGDMLAEDVATKLSQQKRCVMHLPLRKSVMRPFCTTDLPILRSGVASSFLEGCPASAPV